MRSKNLYLFSTLSIIESNLRDFSLIEIDLFEDLIRRYSVLLKLMLYQFRVLAYPQIFLFSCLAEQSQFDLLLTKIMSCSYLPGFTARVRDRQGQSSRYTAW